MKVTVLRLGHRVFRDKRLTTHVALTARALGADEVVLSGEKDDGILDSILDICDRWGGHFKVSYEKNWKGFIEQKKREGFIVVHLTVYGELIQDRIKEIRTETKLLVIVGGEKVPSEVYKLSDFNISVTNQPHSEVAALAVFLHEYFQGSELNIEFVNPKIKVLPKKCGKDVIKLPK